MHAAKLPASSLHANVAPASEVNVRLAEVLFDGSAGAALITGAAGAVVSST